MKVAGNRSGGTPMIICIHAWNAGEFVKTKRGIGIVEEGEKLK